MTSLNFKKVDYNVVFVDPTTMSLEGTGESAESPLKDLPETLVNNTCYIIRRTSEENEVSVKHQVDHTLCNIMFLGAPKESDEKWIKDLASGLGIETWMSDPADYANVKFWHRTDGTDQASMDRACLNSSAFEDVTAINCYLYRKESSATQSNYNRYYVSPFFTTNKATDLKANFCFYGCKFGLKGMDLNKDEWLKEHANFEGMNTDQQYYDEWCRMFIIAPHANSFVLDNCVINHIGYNQATSDAFSSNSAYWFERGQAFSFDDIKTVQILNTTINTGSIYCGGSYDTVIWAANVLNASVHNLVINHIVSDKTLQLPLRFGVQKYGQLDVNKVDIYFKKLKDYEYTGELYNLNAGVYIEDSAGFGHNISDVTLHGKGDVKVAQACALYLLGRGGGKGVPFSWSIKGIKIELSDNFDECVFKTYKNNESCLWLNLHYNSDDTFGTSSNFVYARSIQSLDRPKVENFEIDAPYCYLCGTKIVGSLGEIRCGLHLKAGCGLDIAKLTCDKLPGSGVWLENQENYVHIKEYVGNPGLNQDYLPISQSFYSNAVYVDKSNVELFGTVIDTNTSDTYTYSQVCCVNMVRDGSLFVRNGHAFAQSWGVTRTGSNSGASLKMYSNYNANSFPLMIGCDPYKGFEVRATKTGKQNLVAYFACKSFAGLDEKDGRHKFKLDVRIPYKNGEDIFYETRYSSTDATWQDDTSVWSDEDCVAKKIVIPVDIEVTDKPIEVKVVYGWYDKTGLVYLDPDFKLEDIAE